MALITTNVSEFLSWRCQGVLDTILQGNACQIFTGGQMLSPGTLITSTSTTDKI